MGILSTIDRSIRASADPGSGYAPFDDFWYNDVPGDTNDSGVSVTEKGALNSTIVWACVLWRFKMFGTLHRSVNERTTQMGEPVSIEAPNHPLYPIISGFPNPGIASMPNVPAMTTFYFHGMISADLHLWGNFYAYILRDALSGRIQALVRITPDKVTPCVKSVGGGPKRLWYVVQGDNGLPVNFYPDEILHIKGLGFDGIKGYSPIRMQMNLLGWNRATTRYGAQFFKNASRPSGIISVPAPIKDKDVKKDLLANLSASGKESGKLILIEGAVTYNKLTMDQDEAQFILTWQAQDKSIATMMEVKPFEVGIMDQMTNNNIEQETISSVTRNLQPFTENVEQQMELQLLSDAPSTGRGGGTERDRYSIETEFKILLKGDTAAQTAHIIAMRDRGIYSGNQCSRYLGEAPFEGGDVRVINAAYVPLDMLQELAKARATAPLPGAPNGAGGPVPAENKQSASIEQMFGGILRAEVGKTIARVPKDREKAAAMNFPPVISGIAEALQVTDFDELDYVASLAKRSIAWEKSQADTIAAEELTRLVSALMEKL